ncbi:MAG TPA: pilus assembly protein PilM [Planctomycetaceae bacterium]|nr:pilus assembly protein PilM [Planctomycetaceae bacterium]
MSDIFIEWDRDRLVVARGRADGNCAEITESWIIERSADATDMFAVVDQLKPIARAAAGKNRPSVTVVFPRQFVAIHRIQLPQVADGELPAMVRMQATMRLTVPVESVSMDFAPLPVIPGSVTRDVLLVTAPGDQVAQARQTLREAGLELKELRVSAFCLAQAAAQAGVLTESADASMVDVVVLMRRDFIEITFVRGTAVLFSHSGNSWSAADTIERTLRSELTRARMSAAESLGDHKIRRILLIGASDATAAVTDQFATRFDSARIERIDPAGVFVRGNLAAGVTATDVVAIAGAIQGDVRTTVAAVDLVNPRKPPEKKDLRRIAVLGGTLAALLLFSAVYFWRQGQINELTETKTVLVTSNRKIEQKLAAGDKELIQAGKIGEWVDRDIEWLDEIVRLQAILPGTDRFFVDNIQFSTVQVNGTGIIKLEGFAKTTHDIEDVGRVLAEAGYGVKPYTPLQSSANAAPEYAFKVVLELSLPEVKHEQAS